MPRGNKIPNEIFSLPPALLCLLFSLPGNHSFRPSLSFQTGDLWKIRENYVNDTAPAESREMLDPRRGKQETRKKAAREVGVWEVGTSSGISLGNLWIIPPVLMKVVRIKNAEIHCGQYWCECRDGIWAKRSEECKWKPAVNLREHFICRLSDGTLDETRGWTDKRKVKMCRLTYLGTRKRHLSKLDLSWVSFVEIWEYSRALTCTD